jgi:hypothetical protein
VPSACAAGALACAGGTVVCMGAVGPVAAIDACGVDSNCDGALTGQPDTATDVHNCTLCGNDCTDGAVHAIWSCAGGCIFEGCQAGWHDLDADTTCEYGCAATGPEVCNGLDDDCDGAVDEGVTVPPP